MVVEGGGDRHGLVPPEHAVHVASLIDQLMKAAGVVARLHVHHQDGRANGDLTVQG